MMQKIYAGLVLLVAMAINPAAHAIIIVDPTIGATGTFSFTSLGPIDSINGVSGNEISVTVTDPSLVDFFLDDCCVIGDEFSVALNGTPLTPTASNPGAPGILFFADYLSVALAPGTNIFEIFLTAACCSSGGAFFEISAAQLDPTAVPEPAGLAVLGLGLLGLGLVTKRRSRAK